MSRTAARNRGPHANEHLRGEKGGKTSIRVPYALAVHGAAELRAVSAVLERHRTILGPLTERFEREVARLFGKRFGIMVNSGSSANLLALEALELPEGSEIITPLLTFSTTVAPIVQKRLVPVFVDAVLPTYLLNTEQIDELIGPKTRALMVPSLLGNVPDLKRLREIADAKGLYLVEDSCDTLGARLAGKPTGAFSHVSTTSFYGSHVITAAGGGGMICVNEPRLDRALRVLRGWGRSSAAGESEDVERRFAGDLDGVPYDSKFVFEAIGYNFLPLEISAAFGLVQLRKLRRFSDQRRQNFRALTTFFRRYEEFFILPAELPRVRTNWLAFPLTIREGAPFTRIDVVRHVEARNIQTRPVFSGNLLRHPGFAVIPHRALRRGYPVADRIMRDSFLIGCHHGLRGRHIQHIRRAFVEFVGRYVGRRRAGGGA